MLPSAWSAASRKKPKLLHHPELVPIKEDTHDLALGDVEHERCGDRDFVARGLDTIYHAGMRAPLLETDGRHGIFGNDVAGRRMTVTEGRPFALKK